MTDTTILSERLREWREDAYALCRECPDCTPVVMCRYHSLLSEVQTALSARETPTGEHICPWCGELLKVLKPSGGCLTAEIHGYMWHPQCADAFEQIEALTAERPRACACPQPDPVMQADDKFYCYTCGFQTGARPRDLEPEMWYRRTEQAEARVSERDDSIREMAEMLVLSRNLKAALERELEDARAISESNRNTAHMNYDKLQEALDERDVARSESARLREQLAAQADTIRRLSADMAQENATLREQLAAVQAKGGDANDGAASSDTVTEGGAFPSRRSAGRDAGTRLDADGA